MADFQIVADFPETQRTRAARLFWEAFQGNLSAISGPETRAMAFLERVADPSHFICALSESREVLGIAGYKTRTAAFIGGDSADPAAIYGRFGGVWRGVFLSLLERRVAPGVLPMDGVMVTRQARGRGGGTSLLDAIKHRAVGLDCRQVRQDVIDTNPRAQALCERHGFVPGAKTGIGPFRQFIGFRRSTTMVWTAVD